MKTKEAVLLVGSGRPHGESTSELLGRYLLERLAVGSYDTRVFFANRLRHEGNIDALVHELSHTSIFIVATPVYVDSLPALVIHALEEIARQRSSGAANLPGDEEAIESLPCQLVGIANCGFPEVVHTHLALDMLRSFARHGAFSWAGGLGLAGGEALRGRSLSAAGWLARNVLRALELTAYALESQRNVPPRAVELMARPLLPPALYAMLGNAAWRRDARRNHVLHDIDAQPFLTPVVEGRTR